MSYEEGELQALPLYNRFWWPLVLTDDAVQRL